MKTWNRGRKKFLTDEQREDAKQRQKNRAKISNIVARKPEIENKCCICGKKGQILHNAENPYCIAFICNDCKKVEANLQKAEQSRFDLRELLNRSKLCTNNFTKEEVSNIVKGYTNTQATTIGEYCIAQNITRHQFSKMLKLYEQYFPNDTTTISAVSARSKAVQRKRLSREAEERAITRMTYNGSMGLIK